MSDNKTKPANTPAPPSPAPTNTSSWLNQIKNQHIVKNNSKIVGDQSITLSEDSHLPRKK